MSPEPTSSSGLPGRSRPVLSELSKETTEEDLWNLDEDPTPAPAVEPQPIPASAPAEPAATVIDAATAPETAAAAPAKPTVIDPTPGGRKAPPERRDVQRMKAVDTFDDLEEDGIGSPDARAATPEPEASPAAAAGQEATETPAKPGDFLSDEIPAYKPKSANLPRRRFLPREIIGLGLFAFAMLLAAVWALSSFFGTMHFKQPPTAMPKFPVTGKHGALAGATTFWREPVTTGPDRDLARRSVVILPVLELSLDPAHSSSGALRVLFRNHQGEPVGDPITRSFRDGKFEPANSSQASFPSTDGFKEMAIFATYQAGEGDPWIVEILEGPSAEAPANQFTSLTRLPVSSLRR